MAVHAAKGRGSFGPIAFIAVAAVALVALVIAAAASEQPEPIELGAASSFAVLAGSGITNTGITTLSGTAGSDIGSSPTGTFTGAKDVSTEGTKFLAVDPIVTTAKESLLAAYVETVGREPSHAIAADIGGSTLTEGVYNSGSSIGLTGTLTLDAQDNPDAVFVFQAGSTLTTASDSKVELINGAQASNVFWQVGSSATFGTGTSFVGHVLAFTSITATTGANFQGQLLAINGAVTLDSNTITNNLGEAPSEPTEEPTETPTVVPTTEPTAEPTTEPTVEPTSEPTHEPTVEPTHEPSPDPSPEPSPTMTQAPEPDPTLEPVETEPVTESEPVTSSPKLEEAEVILPPPTEEGEPPATQSPDTTDTGGQLPNTETVGWLIPLGAGAVLAALGFIALLMRRQLS
jgi:hypothetical protein